MPHAQGNGQNRDAGDAPCWHGCGETEAACVHEMWVWNDKQRLEGGSVAHAYAHKPAVLRRCLQTGKHMPTRRRVGRCPDAEAS